MAGPDWSKKFVKPMNTDFAVEALQTLALFRYASDCSDFSLNFQNFRGGGGGHAPGPPLKISSFFSVSNSRLC